MAIAITKVKAVESEGAAGGSSYLVPQTSSLSSQPVPKQSINPSHKLSSLIHFLTHGPSTADSKSFH